ncbi:MAG: hypothetical protein IJ454_01955 [Clostridia bacterium]|nr:hypothetical protein [Clostridia bacterium]
MNIPMGREDIARLFQNCIQGDRLAQAYIICADKGMGKKTIAEYATSLMLCRNHTSCGECPSCKSLAAHTHPDVVELRRSEDKATLSVDNVRAVKGEVYTKPAMADYKVVTVYEMHLATPAAQNAMLKMIEEPPERVVFLMLCDTMSPILQTIVSRSVVIDLKPLPGSVLKQISGATDFEISASGGNIGRLMRLKEDADYVSFRDEVVDSFASLASQDPYAPYEASARIDKLKAHREEVFGVLLMFVRDAYLRSRGLTEQIVNKDKINYIDSFAGKLSPAQIWRIMNLILEAEREKGKNGNFSIAVTVLFLRCQAAMKKQKG